MTATTFPLFKDLPNELQAIIWGMAFEEEDWLATRQVSYFYDIARTELGHQFTGTRTRKIGYYDGHTSVLKGVCRVSMLMVLGKWLSELKGNSPEELCYCMK